MNNINNAIVNPNLGKTRSGSGVSPTNSGGTIIDGWFESADSNQVTMDDFISLMISQLSNQDFMNPVDDTQYVTQLAQFSSMQAMQELALNSKTTHALSMVGKTVTVARLGVGGKVNSVTGVVEKVMLTENRFEVYVDGTAYQLSEVMSVNTGASSSEDGSFATSLVGKNVTFVTKDKDGKEETTTGIVDKVTVDKGKYTLHVGDKKFSLDNIQSVNKPADNSAETTNIIKKSVTTMERMIDIMMNDSSIE